VSPASGLGTRERALERLAASRSEPLDVLIVGGGITGAGAALDAASRGMRVGLVERVDFASGTSSKSSKLIHGGLRYLEQREFGLVREASLERRLLGRLAPHLVQSVPFVIPVTSRLRRAQFGVGLWAYDALATFRNSKFHRYLDREETEELVPALPRGKVRGGFSFYDSKTDDVRLVMENLVQAVRLGAVVVNHAGVVGLAPDDERVEVKVRDEVTDHDVFVHARRVLVAAGVWTDQVEHLAHADVNLELRPSKGIHLVFSRDSIPLSDAGAFIPDVARRRMLFVIPWLDSVLVGTTDTRYEGDIDAPSVEPEDRAYCLESLNAAFGLDLSERDVSGAFAGLRPLIAGKHGETADLSRRHRVYEMGPGVYGVTGGKLTTYRRMAAEAVDKIASDLDVSEDSKTRWIKLGCASLTGALDPATARARRLGMDPSVAANLVRCYGDRALDVLDLAAAEDLTQPLVAGHPPVAAEALYTARHEMAVHLGDVLARRTRLALVDPAGGAGPRAPAPEIMGAELGWDADAVRDEIASYRAELERERGLPLGDAVAPSPSPSSATTG
jgi:glycerol-3-phosphate dehydrogenase